MYLAYTRLQGNLQSENIDDYLGTDRPETSGIDELEPFKEGKPVNLLLIGSDVREGDSDIDGAGQTGQIEGMRSDTTMLVHVSADRQRVEVVSIPRDTLVEIPSCRLPSGEWTQSSQSAMFNSAFSLGGQTGDVGAAAACTIRTVEKLTGVYIDGFMVVDFASFRHFVEALGGVNMCFNEDLYDPASGLDLTAGCHRLNGEQALAFARARKSIGDGSDIGRMDRQQELVRSMINEAVSKNLTTNLPSLYTFIDAVSQSVVMNSDLADIDTLASFGTSVRGVDPDSIVMMTMPWEPVGARVLPSDEAELLWQAFREDTPVSSVLDTTDATGEQTNDSEAEDTPADETTHDDSEEGQL